MWLLPTSYFKRNNRNQSNYRSFSSKYFVLLCLFVLSILVTACGSSTSASTANPGDPPVTVTINIGNGGGSPTPTLPGYECGAWATNTTPLYGTRVVGVYAKFVQLVNGSPVGVAGANATATVIWPDGTNNTITGTTGSDGLVTFAVSTAGRADALMKLVYITVAFSANGVPPCNVNQDRAAFFMLTTGASETPTVVTTGGGGTTTGGGNGTGTGPQPTVTVPGPGPTPQPKPGGGGGGGKKGG
ncbi:MAG TPA: hypothetical protein DHW02_07775 [Ktedonobacter sp.]|nr:hypothetical protein [Ktedonobacter sp.]